MSGSESGRKTGQKERGEKEAWLPALNNSQNRTPQISKIEYKKKVFFKKIRYIRYLTRRFIHPRYPVPRTPFSI